MNQSFPKINKLNEPNSDKPTERVTSPRLSARRAACDLESCPGSIIGVAPLGCHEQPQFATVAWTSWLVAIWNCRLWDPAALAEIRGIA